MTDDEIRLAVGKELGWFLAPKHWKHNGSAHPDIETWISPLFKDWPYDNMPPGTWLGGLPPDYPNDLNACRELVSNLTPDEKAEMNRLLLATRPGNLTRYKWEAEASEFCEAFLRVKGKWKEKPPEADRAGVI